MSRAADNATSPIARLEPGFFERLFEGAGLPICVCDLEGRLQACNSLAAELLGARRGATRVRDLLPEHARAQFDESFEALHRTGGQPLEFRMSATGLDGEVNEYATWLTPIHDAEGRLSSVAVWFHDITARVQFRRSLRKRERLTALGALCGSVAHHYNNLLCSIMTSLEYAMNMNTMAAMRRALRRTSTAAARANDLTQQLLAFAQADYRGADMADLTETTLHYFDEHERQLRDKRIDLVVEWKPVPSVAVPRDQFLIVLNNLVRNATEAMPDGGKLEVAIHQRDEEHVSVTICDSGPGVPPEHMERLFEPFFTTKGELAEGGTHQPGMGLAVAHGLVSEMHGAITVANRPEGGLRFEIILPIPSPSEPPSAHLPPDFSASAEP